MLPALHTNPSPAFAPTTKASTKKTLRPATSYLAVRASRWIVLLVCIIGVTNRSRLAVAQPSRSPSRSQPKNLWQVASHDCQLQLISHQRIPAADGHPPSDRIRMVTGRGEYAHVACAIQPLSIIDELELSVPFFSDQAGQQVLARVVLPRATDPKTGQPLTFRIPGQIYATPGKWQQLHLPNIARELDQYIRILRSEHGPDVDGREAFVDHLIVNIYAGVGSNTTRLGDPEIRGAVAHGKTLLPQTHTAPDPGRLVVQPASAALRLTAPRKQTTFRLEGDVLLVGDRPFFVRGIQARGENWEYLKQLGFNTLQLSTPVTGEQVQRAERLNLWLIAPPPAWTNGDLGQPYRRVLAWDLGNRLTSANLQSTRERANAVRAADRARRRPILCSPDTDLAAFDEVADILLHHREPIGSSFPVDRHRGWLASRSALSLAGTPHWAMIQTEPLPEVLSQAAAFGFHANHPQHPNRLRRDLADDVLHVSTEQMESLALGAVATGMRGILFASRSRLDADTTAARTRAAAIRSLNLKLDAIAPWIAGGHVAARDVGSDPATPTTVLRTARSWLILPSRLQQTVVEELTIPGIPGAVDVFEFGPTGLSRLAHERITGGVRLGKGHTHRMVLITRDPLVIGHIHDKLVNHAPIAAELDRQIAQNLYGRTERLLAKLGRSDELLKPAQPLIAACDAEIHSGQYPKVHRVISDASAIIQSERLRLKESTEVVAMTELNLPWSDHLDAAAWQIELPNPDSDSQRPNHLATGEVEDLAAMREAGWRNWEHAQTGIETSVELTGDSPQSGQRCLRLTTRVAAASTNGSSTTSHGYFEKPSLWITSPTLQLPPGTRVMIRGSVRMTAPLAHSYDGALLFDSVGGSSLALRVEPNDDWQPFSIIRAVDERGELSLTLALTGLGQVDLDDLSVVELDSQ